MDSVDYLCQNGSLGFGLTALDCVSTECMMKDKNWPISGANSVNQSKTEVNTSNGRENMCGVWFHS